MKLKLLLTIVGVAVLGVSAHAQFLTSAPVTADSNVINTGTTKLAASVFAVIGGPTEIVNGVTFSGPQLSQGYTISGFFNDAVSGAVVQQSGMSSAFSTVLSYALINSGSGTATVTGLTVGHTYELQIFAGLGAGGSGSETISDGVNTGLLTYGTSLTPSGDEYVIDTFSPTTSSETFDFTAVTGGNVVINAFDLRDEGVPEPSTYAMLLAGGLWAWA